MTQSTKTKPKTTQPSPAKILYRVGDSINYEGHDMIIVDVQDKSIQLKAKDAPYFSFPVDLPIIPSNLDSDEGTMSVEMLAQVLNYISDVNNEKSK